MLSCGGKSFDSSFCEQAKMMISADTARCDGFRTSKFT
ncbi:hypothetical protein ACPOL_5551 [Acidisarcina polymorpha]|uniref:Uncharacterized protein n=1 Tax=Acidisarcina polymorpha TaxID=2211140 RepID=A0A2Z5G739_9BACT|nr:hypothetical protein ACPOL_5551 [Acidisarcina polymorpha]